MPYKNLNEIPLITELIIMALGIVGAIVNFAKRKERVAKLSSRLYLFFVDMITSGGLAVIGFYGASGLGMNELTAIAVSGILAHQGTRAMYLIELVFLEKAGAKQTFNEVKENKEMS